MKRKKLVSFRFTDFDYLRNRFDQEKIIVVGHSYGTILGTNYVAGHQDKVSCYVGVSTAVGGVQGYILGYEDALRHFGMYREDRRHET